jgi:mannose-1-phosphate guanylyltransferase
MTERALVSEERRAAIILAGGEGTRLNPLTRMIFGHDVPKQFCPLFEGETLLELTMRRVSFAVPIGRTITVLNRDHEKFYAPVLPGIPYSQLLVQPANRGTAPAILAALLRLIETGHARAVAIFPSDHYVSDDSALMRYVDTAFTAVEAMSGLIVLLGATPNGPETDYGWVETSEPISRWHSTFGQIWRIRRFWEKPSPEVACKLYGTGCLWNSFILVADAAALLGLIMRALPEVHASVSRARSHLGGRHEKEALEILYSELPPLNFSERVLAKFPTETTVLPFSGVEWSDLGDPTRLLAVVSNTGLRPQWLDRLRFGIHSGSGGNA